MSKLAKAYELISALLVTGATTLVVVALIKAMWEMQDFKSVAVGVYIASLMIEATHNHVIKSIIKITDND